ETNLSAHILIDKSASMGFGSSGMTKFDYGRTLAAAFAWILIRQKDAVGLAAFDEEISGYLSPKSTNLQLKNIISHLETAAAQNKTMCGYAINDIAAMLKKRGLCVVISDFFDEPESIAKGLRHLRFKRQDILAVAVADPMELNFNGKSDLCLKDLETGEIISIDSQTAAQFFNSGFAAHHAKLKSICRELEIDFEVVTTEQPFHSSLMRVIEKRRRLF
ncbi:MAG: VWA domain-containing protein, partial [Chitinispirillales bacterium]|nr:VWA domain-containing protein [Chitinispirillales bacterium]